MRMRTKKLGGRFSSLRAAHSIDATQACVRKVDWVDINIDNVSSRTKKINMTPIRFGGDDDDEGDGDDDEDEDEESTPVPRSKRSVARCVFYFILYLRKFLCLLTMNYLRAHQKNDYRKACSRENEIPQKRHRQGAGQCGR
jgi:hypothetical protein